MIWVVGLAAWILRMASRAWASAAAVTVQVLRTTTSAETAESGEGTAAIEELALDGGAVGLGGAAAELFDVKGGHRGNSLPVTGLAVDSA